MAPYKLSKEWHVVTVITLDGPSGCGKGTLSQRLAKKLSYRLLDSGALYRVVAFSADQDGNSLSDTAALLAIIAHLDLQFKASVGDEPARIVVSGEDVTDCVRSDDVALMASEIAKNQDVRKALLPLQQAFAQAPGLVADGRDMGTVVFPQAQHKFYLDAAPRVRAGRRYKQLKQKGLCVSLGAVQTEIEQRDKNDRNRQHSPLQAASDAVVVDTSALSVDAVLTLLLSHLS